MATRRTGAAAEKPTLSYEATQGEKGPKSNISPAVPSSVIAKLLGFTFAMFALPIGSYFATVNRVFNGNSTYAGALAAVLANAVLIGYVIVAFRDDQSEREEEERKKTR